MSFGEEVRRFADKAKAREREVFVGAVHAVKDSIVNGSPTTGAPGQPVAEGGDAKLKESFVEEISGDEGAVYTTVDYAPEVEDAIRENGQPMHFASPTGGPHSVKLTRAGFQKLVDEVARDVVGGDA